MRRITGTYEGVEHVILEYERGIVECPSGLTKVLEGADHSLPTGEELLVQCRVLFGDTMQVREI